MFGIIGPMQLSTTIVHMVDIVEEVALWGEKYQETYVQAFECGGKE